MTIRQTSVIAAVVTVVVAWGLWLVTYRPPASGCNASVQTCKQIDGK